MNSPPDQNYLILRDAWEDRDADAFVRVLAGIAIEEEAFTIRETLPKLKEEPITTEFEGLNGLSEWRAALLSCTPSRAAWKNSRKHSKETRQIMESIMRATSQGEVKTVHGVVYNLLYSINTGWPFVGSAVVLDFLANPLAFAAEARMAMPV